jgi:hypothetical protein
MVMNVLDFIKLAAVSGSDLQRGVAGMKKSGLLVTSVTGGYHNPVTTGGRLVRDVAKERMSKMNPTQVKNLKARGIIDASGYAELMKSNKRVGLAQQGFNLKKGDLKTPKVIMPDDIPFLTRGMDKSQKDTFLNSVALHENREAKLMRSKRKGNTRIGSHLGFSPIRLDINTGNALSDPLVAKRIKKARRADITKLKKMFPDLSDRLERGWTGEQKFNRHFDKVIDRRLAAYNAAAPAAKPRRNIKTDLQSLSSLVSGLFKRRSKKG